jgi:competence protein ComEC
MKKLICLALVLAMCLSLVACGTANVPDNSNPPPSQSVAPTPEPSEAPSPEPSQNPAPEPTASADPKPTAETSVQPTPETTPSPSVDPSEPPIGSTFKIHFIDVGQADAALVLCDGKAMLIDGGNSEDSNLIYSYLKKHGVSHLDYIVATHAHEDHVGGLSGALNYATVGTALCSVTNYDSEAFNDFVKYLGKQNVSITVPAAGDSFKLGSATVQILAPIKHSDDPNNMSIVLRIVYFDTSFLFTGDAEREEEQDILNAGYPLESTVLKVGHHGSDSSTTYPFLREIMPEYAVISVGNGNSYGHPTEDTLSRLRDADVKVFRTDMQGHIICTSSGKSVFFTVERNEDANTLQSKTPIEKLKDIVSASCYAYNTRTVQKLGGTLTYEVVSSTEVQLYYDVKNPVSADKEYLLDEVMDQILDYVIDDINETGVEEEVTVYITVNYEHAEETEPDSEPEPSQSAGRDYILNTNTKKFHYPSCSSVKQMSEKNKAYFTGTREELIAKGYDPCGRCNP